MNLTWALGQNPELPEDTNADHFLSPVDVLITINAINNSAESDWDRLFKSQHTDVNGDGETTPRDVLAVIHRLNENGHSSWRVKDLLAKERERRAARRGGGHGESEGCSPTIFGPTDVNEYQIFTVTGFAPDAWSISFDISQTVWGPVDAAGSAPGFTYDPVTGIYTQMLIILDDNPTDSAEDPFTVTVTADGSCSGSASYSGTVHNVEIGSLDAAILEIDPIVEGDTASLQVTFTDATIDGQTITVDWGDGTTSTRHLPYWQPPDPFQWAFAFLTDPTLQSFSEVFSHQFEDDNPTGTDGDIYDITVTVKDDDTSEEVVTTSQFVANAPPEVFIDAIIPLDSIGEPTDTLIESGSLRVIGHVTDRGILDTHTGKVKADLNWDGDTSDTGEEIAISGGSGSWTFDVTFGPILDDGLSGTWDNGTTFDELNINATVTDDDTGTGDDDEIVLALNVEPRFEETPEVHFSLDEDGDNRPDFAMVQGAIFDSGSLDAHEITVFWGDDSSSTISLAAGVTSFSIARPMTAADGDGLSLLPAQLKVRDDDLGTGFATVAAACLDITIEFSAFIPIWLGLWLDEPGQAPGGTNYQFRTDARIFGEPGSSRMSSIASINSCSIGISPAFGQNTAGASHRREIRSDGQIIYWPPMTTILNPLRADLRISVNSPLFQRRRSVLDTLSAETSLIAARNVAHYNRPDRTVRE